MDVVNARCAGLDVHKRMIVACRLTPGPRGHPLREVASFRTTTAGLLELSDWLASVAVAVVAMESTGSFWKPVYNVLEGRFEILVVNAQHLKAVPGRKTDVRDAEWIADLLRHGLLRPSFIPDRPARELRELTRYRTVLLQQRSAEVNRIQKVLEGANIKLASVASNVVGISGREMLEGLISGETDPERLAAYARGRLRQKRDALVEALAGRFGLHQAFLLSAQLRMLDTIDELIERTSAEIAARLAPLQAEIDRLQTVPGIGQRTAETILAEVGHDMSRFPTSRHLASWAGLCPGSHESAGKSRSGRARKGSPWLRSMLVEAAKSAGRSDTYLGARYKRLAARRGAKRATFALAHELLVSAFHILDRGVDYQDLGTTWFDERDRERTIRRLTGRIEALGYHVSAVPSA
jgi:transposase